MTARVLVVDDSAVVRALVEAMLVTIDGVEIVQAGDGAEAYEKLAGVTLVVTDLAMPVMDGRELIAKLRDEPAHAALPVVMLTTRSHEQEAYAAGANAFVAKPIERGALVDTVKRLLQR